MMGVLLSKFKQFTEWELDFDCDSQLDFVSDPRLDFVSDSHQRTAELVRKSRNSTSCQKSQKLSPNFGNWLEL